MLKVAMLGASGRMGRSIIGCLQDADDFELVGAVTGAADPALGADAGTAAGGVPAGVALTDDLRVGLDHAQVAIDFTLPGALEGNLAACVAAGVPAVIGTEFPLFAEVRAYAVAARPAIGFAS